MGLHTRKQFADLIGMAFDKNGRANIAKWAKRQNIVMSGDLIDDTLEVNRNWILRQQTKSNPEPLENVPVFNEVIIKQKRQAQYKDPDSSALEGFALSEELKKHQIEKLKVDTRIQELKEEKIRGEVVPIDLIKQVFITHNQSILTANKDFIDSLLLDFQAETRLSSEQSAKLRGKIVQGLNTNVNRAVDATKRNMSSIIEQHSIKKEVGERE